MSGYVETVPSALDATWAREEADRLVLLVDEEGNDIREAATPENSRIVSIAGRMMGRRIMGKAGFAELQDSKGRIQVYVQRDAICPGEDKEMYNKVFKKLLDIGDFIGVRGYVFRTKTGEISVHAQELTLLSKSLKMEKSVVDYEPHVALFGGDDGLFFYRKIMENAHKVINPHSFLAFEIGYDEKQAICALVEQYFPNDRYEVLKDLNGKDRMLFIYHNL